MTNSSINLVSVSLTPRNNETSPHHSIGSGTNNDSDSDGSGDAGPSSEPQLPIEYQLHEADLSDPDMDPLEHTFRKYVPIPRAYYWDTAAVTNDHHRDLPFRTKAWHCGIYYLGALLGAAESGGEIVANVLGLNDGPFDYVTRNMTPEETARSRETVEIRREERAEAERRRAGVV